MCGSAARRSLQYLNIRLNSISVVNLVLSLGLSVDMSAHIAHRFLGASGGAATGQAGAESAADRVERTLWVLGASVFNGGWSTLMAVLPLVFTSSTVSGAGSTAACAAHCACAGAVRWGGVLTQGTCMLVASRSSRCFSR